MTTRLTGPPSVVPPRDRGRRLRRTEALRRMSAEVRLSPADLVAPLFVKDGVTESQAVPSLPGQCQFSLDGLLRHGERLVAAGIPAVMLFGVPARKDSVGSAAWASDGIVPRALRALREHFGDRLALITDLCLCDYTDHGHCGPLAGDTVDNDETLALYQRVAVAQAAAGADLVAPSGMMDGQVAAIRAGLDEAGFTDRAIMAYSAKYASAFYGPFRDAAESSPRVGDRRGYQMDPANGREADLEVRRDVDEGADIVMVKPALAYLDVIHRIRRETALPVAAYNVSGEYAMVHAAAERGWLDGPAAAVEVLSAIKRAGADMVLTYHALDVAEQLRKR
ncbi:porphobilinogen synthase [Actinosynnema sp. CS-041913]|uniref:porphobilinogen synthase n=1 Tax=Actinosynnema sp. CS-041913 TaxID=3239917 RepID=UPI003D90AEFD